MAFVRYHDGPRVAAAKPRPPRPDRGQDRARRDLAWLRAVEVGFPDPVAGRVRTHTTGELARLWGVSRRTVSRGIAHARALLAVVQGGVADAL